MRQKGTYETSQKVDDRYLNGLESMDPTNLSQIIKDLNQGELSRLDSVFRTVKLSDTRIKRNLSEVCGTLARNELNIVPWAADGEEPTDQAQDMAKTVTNALAHINITSTKWELGFNDLKRSIVESYYRGYGVYQTIWQNKDGLIYPAKFLPVTAQNYKWSNEINGEDRLVLCPNGIGYEELDFPKDKFLICLTRNGHDHPVWGGEAIPLIMCAGYKQLGIKWFMSFCQLFGVPWRHIISNDTEARNNAIQTMREYGSAGLIVSEEGVDVNIYDSKQSGQSLPQREIIALMDQYIDSSILGGDLISGSGDGVGSYALSKTQEHSKNGLFANAGEFLLGVLNTQLIPSIIRYNYGEQCVGCLPYYEFRSDNTGDEDRAISKIERAIKLGMPLSKELVYDSFGLPQPDDGVELFDASSRSTNPDAKPDAKPTDQDSDEGNDDNDADVDDVDDDVEDVDDSDVKASAAQSTDDEDEIDRFLREAKDLKKNDSINPRAETELLARDAKSKSQTAMIEHSVGFVDEVKSWLSMPEEEFKTRLAEINTPEALLSFLDNPVLSDLMQNEVGNAYYQSFTNQYDDQDGN